MTNQPVQRPIALTTCTKAGKAATVKKRKASTSTPRRAELEQTRNSWLLMVETREKMSLV